MTNTVSFSHFGSEFKDFLFAPVGEDGNGMPLSVLSALARLDVDPWQEAADLARLPGRTAIQRLTALIAALPDELSGHRDPGTIAARLIALLPRRAGIAIAPGETMLSASMAVYGRTAICVIFMVAVLGAQWFVATHLPPAPVTVALAPAASTVLPGTPPPSASPGP